MNKEELTSGKLYDADLGVKFNHTPAIVKFISTTKCPKYDLKSKGMVDEELATVQVAHVYKAKCDTGILSFLVTSKVTLAIEFKQIKNLTKTY